MFLCEISTIIVLICPKFVSFGLVQEKTKLSSPKNSMANYMTVSQYCNMAMYGNMVVWQIKVTNLFLQENSILYKFISFPHAA